MGVSVEWGVLQCLWRVLRELDRAYAAVDLTVAPLWLRHETLALVKVGCTALVVRR